MTADPKKNRWPLPEYPENRQCHSCGAAVSWIRTSTGKPMPLSLRTKPLKWAGKILEPSVIEIDGERWAQSHFADCLQAKAWRRKEER